MNIVANNVKRILEETGTKHKKAAELCGYSQQRFSAMLNGRRVIKTEDVIATNDPFLNLFISIPSFYKLILYHILLYKSILKKSG